MRNWQTRPLRRRSRDVAPGGRGRAICALLLFLCLLTGSALAHPLGPPNADSVTTFRLTPTELQVDYVVVFKEAAALTVLPQLDQNNDGRLSDVETAGYVKLNQQHFFDNLHLQLDGKPLSLQREEASLRVETGANGLNELHSDYRYRVLWTVEGDQPHTLSIQEKSFEGIGGWREIRAVGEEGLGLLKAPNPPQNAMEALQTTASVEFHRGPNVWVASQASVAPTGPKNRLLDMISSGQSPKMLLLTLFVAYVLGALHGLQPGHGKTVVGAYLIGSRGTIHHAIFLGAVVTFTHTSSVILLGVFCLLFFRTVPDGLLPWIGCASGLLISVMGYLLITNRWNFGHSHSHGHSHGHGHGHGHSHEHEHAPVRPPVHAEPGAYAGTVAAADLEPGQRLSEVGGEPVATPAPAEADPWAGHGHSHAIPDKLNLIGLISLGVSGGLVPCPDAIIVLLGAIHLNKLALGLMVLLAFSAGLASILMAVGILMVTAARFVAKRYPSNVTVRRISELSYLAIILMGLGMAFQSLWAGGVIKL